MHTSSVLPLALLPILPLVYASPSWTAGNVSSSAPFGLSASAMVSARSGAKSGVGHSVTGYNLSLPASNITPPTGSSGSDNAYWVLEAAFTPDFPLTEASSPAVDKNKSTEITFLGLYSGNGANKTYDTKGWKVCATVFVGGVPGTTLAQFSSPSCKGVLPDECVQSLQSIAASDALDGDGNCRDIVMPAKCAALGADGAQITTEITGKLSGIGRVPLMDRTFFAYGSEPSDKGNNVTVTEAANWIWPVVINWVHLAENSSVQSSNAVLSCMTNQGYVYEKNSAASSGWVSGVVLWSGLAAAIGLVVVL